MKLVNTQTRETLATIQNNKVHITPYGLSESLQANTIRVAPCNKQLFGGREWISPQDSDYADAFYLYVIESVMKNRNDLGWEKEQHDKP